MHKTLIRAFAVILEIAALAGYNNITTQREAADKAAYAEYQQALAELAAETEGGLTDGAYEGTGFGFGGDIAVRVTIEAGRISGVEVLSADDEDAAYLDMAMDVIPEIIDAQSAEVDAISGATFSSSGIIEAAANALAQAE